MNQSKIKLVAAQINYKKLTNKLESRIYAIGKAHMWLAMINDGQRPTKWNKPNARGTKVTIEYTHSQNDNERAFDEFEVYLKQINREFGLDIKVNRHVEGEEVTQ